MKDKKTIGFLVILGILILANLFACIDNYNTSRRNNELSTHLGKLVDEWNEFEDKYAEDINNIDNLRSELRSIHQERDGWEKIAMELKDERDSYKFKLNECYSNRVVKIEGCSLEFWDCIFDADTIAQTCEETDEGVVGTTRAGETKKFKRP